MQALAAACVLLSWLAGGCESKSRLIEVTAVSEAESPATGGAVIDAGLVAMDRAGYFCLPLVRTGLPADSKVTDVQSSCDCIHARVVKFRSADNSSATAILLEYVAEISRDQIYSAADSLQPVNLRAVIDLKLDSGREHQFEVDLLHTFWSEDAER